MRKMLSFAGYAHNHARAGRKLFWIIWLGWYVAVVCVAVLYRALLDVTPGWVEDVLIHVPLALTLVMWWCFMLVLAARIRDVGGRGWYVVFVYPLALLFFLVPLVVLGCMRSRRDVEVSVALE